MNKTVFFSLFFFVSLCAFCENNTKRKIYPVEVLEVVDINLLSTLDTIIQMKEEIKVYKGAPFFLMEFNEDSLKTDLIFISAYEKIYYHYPDILGCFEYENHFIVVRGNAIDSTLFQRTCRKKNIDFSFPPTKYAKNGEPIIGTLNTFVVWSMRYKLREFRILSFFTDNEDDEWFDCIDEEYGSE